MSLLKGRGKIFVGMFFAVGFLGAFVLMIRSSLSTAGSLRGKSLELTTLYPDKPIEAIQAGALLHKKKLTVINFWASWCPPCIEEAPYLRQLYNAYNSDGAQIQFVAIASSDDRYAALSSEKYGMSTYQQYFDDNDSQLSRANNVSQLPQTFLVDHTGKVLIRLKGMLTAKRLKKWQRTIDYRLPRQSDKR